MTHQINVPAPFTDTGLQPATTYYYKARLSQAGYWGPLYDAIALTTGDIIAEDFRGRVNADNIELAWWSRSAWDYAEIWISDVRSNYSLTLYAYTTESVFFDYKVESGNEYSYYVRLVKDGHAGAYTSMLRFAVP